MAEAPNGYRTLEFEVLKTEKRENGETALSLFVGPGRPPLMIVIADGYQPLCEGDFITLLCPVLKLEMANG